MSPRRRRGSQAIEFALVLPVLCILGAGVVDLGQYMFLQDGVTAAVAQGARVGALSDAAEGEDPIANAQAAATTAWTTSDMPGTLTVTATLVGSAPDQRIVVDATTPFTSWFGFVTFPANITYRATVRMMYQP